MAALPIKERILNKIFAKEIKPRISAFITELVDDDILSVHSKRTYYKSNEYQTYGQAVKAINSKYNGTADYGVFYTGNIIDVRAAFTIPTGLDVIKKTEEECFREMSFVQEFMRFNELDMHVPQEWAKESEIEAKTCIVLVEDKDHEWEMQISETKKIPVKGMIKIRFFPWTTYKYIVETGADYSDFTKIRYKDKDGEEAPPIPAPKFTYRRFGGRVNRPNHPAMKIWKCITQIENLDKALRDWREINNIFAAPILGLKCEDKKDVAQAKEDTKNWNMRIRKIFAYYGTLSYISPSIAGVDSLMKEIVSLAKIISGTTGVPVHFLGLPDLMSNRSTAENLMELIWASTVKEREVWNSAYNEVLFKAIDLYNNSSNKYLNGKTPIRQDLIEIAIQNVTSEQWLRLEKVYLPLYQESAITLDYLLMQIPGLDIEDEKKRREADEKSELLTLKDEMAKKELELMAAQNADKSKEVQDGQPDQFNKPGISKSGGGAGEGKDSGSQAGGEGK